MKVLFAICLLMVSWTPMSAANPTSWQAKVQQEMPLLGHRNWIVIVDSAYPLQTSPGIETVETGTDQLTVLRDVLQAISLSPHVRPLVYMDAELPFVPEQNAPGVTKYRDRVRAVLGNLPVHSMLHEQLIQQLNETSNSFHVLILKTTLTVPYTSVFLQLNCKYWSDDSERQLRQAMKNGVPPSSDAANH